jgi:hypothetical protein
MSGTEMRTARRDLGLTQQQAARRWKVSQAYLSLMEHDKRRVPERLARVLVRREPRLATALPVESAAGLDDLPKLLGALGYPRFAYLAERRNVMNPATVVLAALEAPEVPARVVEALPWVLATFPNLDWNWLVDRARLANVQNRLGYLVMLASQVAASRASATAVVKLANVQRRLEEARLVREDTLGRDLTEVEKRHLRQHRPAAAAHWNVLTNLHAEDLRYGA